MSFAASTVEAPPALPEGRRTGAAGGPEGYSDEELPLGSYVTLAGLFNLSLAIFLVLSKRAKCPIPDRISLGDILLVGMATFKLSRILTKDLGAAPLRAPSTRVEAFAGAGEVTEAPRVG